MATQCTVSTAVDLADFCVCLLLIVARAELVAEVVVNSNRLLGKGWNATIQIRLWKSIYTMRSFHKHLLCNLLYVRPGQSFCCSFALVANFNYSLFHNSTNSLFSQKTGLQPPHLPLQLISMWASPNCQSPWPLSWKCSKRNRQKLFPHFLPTASKRDIHKTLGSTSSSPSSPSYPPVWSPTTSIGGNTRQCRTMWASLLAIGLSSPSIWLYFLFIPVPIYWQNAFSLQSTISWEHAFVSVVHSSKV